MLIQLFPGEAKSQSLEVYGGNRRAGVDLMWFKRFRDREQNITPFLFFSRNRASNDYEGSPSLFGSVNAVSYNLRNGLGVVGVATFSQTGLVPKAGIQYYTNAKDLMLFGWLVADLKSEGAVDLFLLLRYQPDISTRLKMFLQAELFPVYYPGASYWNLTQRFRTGLRMYDWAAGLMTDLNQSGTTTFTTTSNIGAFIRYEFK
jgi:hypothetical protein